MISGNRHLSFACLVAFAFACPPVANDPAYGLETNQGRIRPNIIFILTDDHRWDSVSAADNKGIRTPNLDRIAARGTRFENAFVTLAICSPSRAACLTGRYGSANGVTSVGNVRLNPGEPSFAGALRDAGYATGVTGKWHLKTSPEECGFEFVSTCWANGTWYDRKFTINGETRVMPGFVDDVTADESIRFVRQSQEQHKPFVLWMCTQVPHMDNKYSWPAMQKYLDEYDVDEMPLPQTWNDDLSGKPEYLKSVRNRTKALEYGYDQPENIRRHARDYYASVQQMDAAVGRVLNELQSLELRDNTWIIFMGDNGWMLGEHGMTSKVLPYEESMRVPMAIRGPRTQTRVADNLVLNIDLTATIYELAGLDIPGSLHGRSLLPLIAGKSPSDWRSSFLYEAPTPQLGSKPLWAVRNKRWKYVETRTGENQEGVFAELYDLHSDSIEQTNVAQYDKYRVTVQALSDQLHKHQSELQSAPFTSTKVFDGKDKVSVKNIPSVPPDQPRTDLCISGVYPHLTTYGVYSQKGAHYKKGHDECGIGAIVPWAGKLWMVNYAPHQPHGSEHKLFSIDPDLSKPITVHEQSVGGTPAGRMIHAESNQLLIAHYLIDAKGSIRVISPKDMPMRVTAIARHLTDPANMVYYVDMEGSIWEANVHTLAVKRLFKKPVPGWHGKGGYSGQQRLVVSNNGEHKAGSYEPLLVGGPAKAGTEEAGVLAQWNGKKWEIIERRQFTEITGPNGIAGGGDADDPIWAIGWDRRSLRLKLLEDGNWHTYLLPKAAYCNEARHGWYTEWPRIREITGGRWMMDMHGMFFEFPSTFTSKNSAGIKPIGSHLRYVPDFCNWNGKLVLASDETSIQGNELAGQPQSNLWFGKYEELKRWGPASGTGGPWLDDEVAANTPSDPFLVAGFDRRVLHLGVGQKKLAPITDALRATDQQRNGPADGAKVTIPQLEEDYRRGESPDVTFTVQVDSNGDDTWTDLEAISVPLGGNVVHFLSSQLDAVWLRVKTDRDCVARAFLHQTSASHHDGTVAENRRLFGGLADVDDSVARGALVYAAKRNRNLRVITSDDRYLEFTKSGFRFELDKPDSALKELLHVEPEFTVDDASVILEYSGRRLRLPKGDAAFDRPFPSGWPRASREVESERHLANIHGTFYEVPLITNGAPPAFHLMRPVSSHRKQITDFCSWNGLLVLAGVRGDTKADSHVFVDPTQNVALWFGGIDDLWKLGKPVGIGGPWMNTPVGAGQPSDPYLMNGYDRKSLLLSHTGDETLTVTAEVDISGNGHWARYRDFNVPPGSSFNHKFQDAFNAFWIRLRASQDATATAVLRYE